MSTWVKDALAAAGVSYRGLADWLHPVYPKASAPAIAAACNPADTGVTFTGPAAKIIAVLTGYQRPRADRRRYPIRIQARLSKSEAAAFNRARAAFGHRTVNDALVYAVRWYIKQCKIRAAETVAAALDGTEKESDISIAVREG